MEIFRSVRNESNVENEGLKTRFGRAASRAVLALAGATTFYAAATALEAGVGHEPRAVAASPGDALDAANGAEKAWCRWPSRWSLCARSQELADVALGEAQGVAQEYGVQLHNGGADAFRHCYWSGLMAQEFGVDTAQGFADRHEYVGDQPEAERNMDWYNNGKGREWGGDQAVDIGARCLQGMLNDELRGMVTEKW
jgi:hypothetical protein